MTAREILMEDLQLELKSIREQMDIVTVKFKDAKISANEFSSLTTLLSSRRSDAQAKLARLMTDAS